MKETELKHKDEVKLVAERQIEKQLKYVGDLFTHPNQRCYEYNTITGELTIAKVECIMNPFATGKKIDIYSGTTEGESRFEQKVIIKENCLYVIALNEKNAKRKLRV